MRKGWPSRPEGPHWQMAVAQGPAASLHAGTAALVESGGRTPVRPLVRVAEATYRALVLGSSQPDAHADRARLAAAGMSLARRRSGGGAVLVGPGECLWVDVVVPVDGPGWDPDIRSASVWIGRRWVEALGDVGVPGAEAWAGGMDRRPWSDRVCFAGVGPGEVLVGTRKLVGIAQRRTRAGAVFQCAVPLRWRPADLASVLALPDATRAALVEDLAGAVATITPELAAALPAALRDRLRAATAANLA